MTEKDTFLSFLSTPLYAGRLWMEEFLKKGSWDQDVVRAKPEGRGAGQPVRHTRRSAAAILRERPKYPEEEKW
jgi:hypothetical protein